MTKGEIISTIGAVGALAGVFAYAAAAQPAFSVVATKPLYTEAVYTPHASWPAVQPLEVYALRRFSQNATGEQIVLKKDGKDENPLTITRLTQNGGMTMCADYSVSDATTRTVRQFCISQYPSGL